MSGTYISSQLRRSVMARDGNCCVYCRIHQDDQFFAFALDHIIAEKHGGQTTIENLCLSCPDCNTFKGSDVGSIDWETGETLTRLYHPLRDIWEEHFQFDETSGEIQPRTSVGRVTLFLLRLNDVDRKMDRKLLVEDQRYPCGGINRV